MAASEKCCLMADARFLIARDNAIGTNPYKGDDSGTPTLDFCFEKFAAGSNLIVGQFIRASGRTFHNVRDAKLQVKEERFLKRREDAGSKATAPQGRPKTISGATKMMADCGGVETGIDSDEKGDQVLCDNVGHQFVVRREDLRLTVGFTATVNIALKIGSLEESITVSGAAPVVDVTSGTTATTFTRETLEVTPTSRNGLVGLMAQAPGVRSNVDVGGSSITEVPASRLFGQSGEPWATLEGVPTTAIVDGGMDILHKKIAPNLGK